MQMVPKQSTVVTLSRRNRHHTAVYFVNTSMCLACSDDRELFKNSTNFNSAEFEVISVWYPKVWRGGLNKEENSI